MPPLCIILAFTMDIALGDPRWMPHPVSLIGRLVTILDGFFVSRLRNKTALLAAGAATVVFIVVPVYFVSGEIIRFASGRLPVAAAFIVTAVLAYTTLSVKGLAQGAYDVLMPLEEGDLPKARERLSMIVGRDTAHLDESEVARGAIETVAENTSDGIIAPLFYLALGGPALALAYKAVNTMDSMIGYKSDRYLYFGRAAARLDDVVNFIPARITGMLFVISAWFLSLAGGNYYCKGSLKILLRDCRNHTSPNSGYPEASVAGALGVRLGGENRYFGVKSVKPFIGEPSEDITSGKIRDAVRLMYTASFMGLILAVLVSAAIKFAEA